ncbi:MAG TPA: glycosyltransferase family 2 protein, partial [Candidatus Aenigmarchaeota archaeon]|nr:glycosyltransferase family 2 protein [Candidatus Aenigmarchaeota archaeon]
MEYRASIVIPAYNEEKNIERVIKDLKALGREYQIIVIDDGSRDRTLPLARKMGAECHRLPKNMGKGYACRTGASLSKAGKIIFLDADAQFYAGDIPKIEKLLDWHDLVIGVRDFSSIPVQRRFSNWFVRRIINLATGGNIKDALCGLRGIKRE